MIEIIGYDVINGTRSRQKRFRHRKVNDYSELMVEREKIRVRQALRHKEECEICLLTRQEFTLKEIEELKKKNMWIEEFTPTYQPC